MDAYEELLTDVKKITKYQKEAKHIEDYDSSEQSRFKKHVVKAIYSEIDLVCPHIETTIIGDQDVCTECGEVVLESTCEKDFKDLNAYEKKGSKDPTRCHKRKNDQRTIYKDIEGMDIPEAIITVTNIKYHKIANGSIFRGSKRKAIIVACLYFAYQEMGDPQTAEDIGKKFNLKKKSLKEGFTRYYETFRTASTTYISPKDLVRQIMIKTKINFTHLRKINRLCDYVENKSALLNRSSPQSVASSIVYFYLCLEPEYKNKLGMTKIRFAKIVDLSDITIIKLGKEIQRIIKVDDVKL